MTDVKLKDWDWYNDDGKESTLIPEQKAIAIYTNPDDDIVIRQQAFQESVEDPFIVIKAEHLQKVIQRLQEIQRLLQQ